MYKTFEDDIEVNGKTMNSVVNALPSIGFFVKKIFLEVGLPAPDEIAPGQFYPQQQWLDAFKLISEKAGAHTLMSIGEKIPENAIFPSDISNIEQALASIDIAYHMNHRKNKQVLFQNGELIEGIGHYGYFKVPNENKIIMTCNNPYNCDFDRGIISAMAKEFQPQVKITHEEVNSCRKLGGETCTYFVIW